MSDRDRDLTGLFVRDIDRIDLPPRAAWRPAPRLQHWTTSVFRPLAFVTATGLVLVAALVAGMTLRDRGAPATSPSPTVAPGAVPSPSVTSDTSTASPVETSAPAASPTPSPAADVLEERFGFVTFHGFGNEEAIARVRSETSADEISSFPLLEFPAVSPDGRSIAYWDPARGTPVLRVRSVASGSSRAVFTGKGDRAATGLAWSPDGAGLVVGLEVLRGFGPGAPSSELWTVDLSGGAVEQIASRSDGWIWVPVAWARERGLVAVGVTGEGGHMRFYEIIDMDQASGTTCDPETPCPYAIRSTPIQAESLGRIRASSSARYVLMEIAGGGTMWWPLAEPEKRSTIDEASSVQWRPGTHEIWWVGGLTPSGCLTVPCAGSELLSYDVTSGARTVKFRGDYLRGVAGFRVDGSAVVLISHGCFAPECTTTETLVVELEQGRTETLTVDGHLGLFVSLR